MGKHSRKAKTSAVAAAAFIPLGLAFGFHHHGGDIHPAGLRALTANPDCTLQAPRDPLSAKGLATPYVLVSAGATCSETDDDTAAFVQATIYDPATGSLSVYNPVVRDDGKALLGDAPPVPVLPRNAVVSIWTGFNGNVLKITGAGARDFTEFAQQSYAGSVPFFDAVNHGIRAGKVKVPAPGTASDGLACPTSRDFSIVDQDQSDNNVEKYPAYGVSNGSDEGTTAYVQRALGCVNWVVPSLSAPGTMATSGQLLEIQAATSQAAPVALVPGLDPFVLRPNGSRSLFLQNLYRAQVDQRPTWNGDDTLAYCQNLAGPSGEGRLKLDAPAFGMVASSNGTGTNLATQLAGRFAATWTNLTCDKLTGDPSPITVTTDANGVFTSAAYK